MRRALFVALVVIALAVFYAARSQRVGRRPGHPPQIGQAKAGKVVAGDFALLLRDGEKLVTDSGEIRLHVRKLGLIKLASGRIVACDPMIMDEPAFERTVDPGEYPVFVALAQLPDGDERVAAAFIRFTEAEPQRWPAATCAGDPQSWAEDERPGYGVDSAMGCFMDADALTLQRVHSETFFNELATAMEENEASRWHGANFNLDQASGLNLVAFETGFGDGVYPSYWGLASDGSVACLLSDFGLLE